MLCRPRYATACNQLPTAIVEQAITGLLFGARQYLLLHVNSGTSRNTRSPNIWIQLRKPISPSSSGVGLSKSSALRTFRSCFSNRDVYSPMEGKYHPKSTSRCMSSWNDCWTAALIVATLPLPPNSATNLPPDFKDAAMQRTTCSASITQWSVAFEKIASKGDAKLKSLASLT